MLSNFLFSKPKNVGNAKCRPTIDRYVDQLSTEYRPSIDRVSTECRLTIDRVSTDYRPLYRSIDRSTLPTIKMIQSFFLNFSDTSFPETQQQSSDGWRKTCLNSDRWLFNSAIILSISYAPNKDACKHLHHSQSQTNKAKRAGLQPGSNVELYKAAM